ncbi:MAG: 1-(5-phosphoribosyl)-5-[(5-phosphoribosylamino)methylideneamino]imidazole-4-carboxamide isomerase [Rikenellaceae bacterium]|nr:1-(5-phosphoribosyl)-5-[(5-phosphoribosylamino)methylideneamino]imidazole-4-carboxamide isomerase [Rikenellaceae bacterium]
MIRIIPAIDIIGGKCVRLTQGDYARQTTYYYDPLDAALRFRDAGLDRLHIVDLDGAKHSAPRNLATLERLAARSGMAVQFGGGIKSGDALRSVLDSGADYAICGSIAVTDPDLLREWLARYGDRLILGADVREGMVATHGWLKDSGTGVEELIASFTGDGLRRVICTDISRDGTLAGPNFELYRRLHEGFPAVEVIVSGGISSMDDILSLDGIGLPAVILGKAFYEGRVTIEDLKSFAATHE